MLDSHNQSVSSRDEQAQPDQRQPEALIKELWLDLEDTVITPVINGWYNTELINIEKVCRFIDEFQPDYVNLFSFAIWNQQQRHGFDHGTRPMLEQAIGQKLNLVLNVDDDIIPICCKEMRLGPGSVDFQEMSNFWGKQGAFRLYMRHHAKCLKRPGNSLHAVLLDDVVFNEVILWDDLECTATISQLNIDRLYHDDTSR